jgi:hypothetical protein
MKNTLLGLMAATLVATPALATSWKNTLFERLDTDVSGELSVKELKDTGCTLNTKFFYFADKDASKGLSKNEFFKNRELFSRCK